MILLSFTLLVEGNLTKLRQLSIKVSLIVMVLQVGWILWITSLVVVWIRWLFSLVQVWTIVRLCSQLLLAAMFLKSLINILTILIMNILPLVLHAGARGIAVMVWKSGDSVLVGCMHKLVSVILFLIINVIFFINILLAQVMGPFIILWFEWILGPLIQVADSSEPIIGGYTINFLRKLQ